MRNIWNNHAMETRDNKLVARIPPPAPPFCLDRYACSTSACLDVGPSPFPSPVGDFTLEDPWDGGNIIRYSDRSPFSRLPHCGECVIPKGWHLKQIRGMVERPDWKLGRNKVAGRYFARPPTRNSKRWSRTSIWNAKISLFRSGIISKIEIELNERLEKNVGKKKK